MPGLTDADRDVRARARKLREADVSEHTGETVLVLAYARWAGQARDLLAGQDAIIDRLLGELAELTKRLGNA